MSIRYKHQNLDYPRIMFECAETEALLSTRHALPIEFIQRELLEKLPNYRLWVSQSSLKLHFHLAKLDPEIEKCTPWLNKVLHDHDSRDSEGMYGSVGYFENMLHFTIGDSGQNRLSTIEQVFSKNRGGQQTIRALAAAFPFLEKIGVKRVALHACQSVGPFYWAWLGADIQMLSQSWGGTESAEESLARTCADHVIRSNALTDRQRTRLTAVLLSGKPKAMRVFTRAPYKGQRDRIATEVLCGWSSSTDDWRCWHGGWEVGSKSWRRTLRFIGATAPRTNRAEPNTAPQAGLALMA